jgi:ribosome modulation factor
MTNSYSEGYVAGEQGTSSSHNPYQPGTSDHKEWLAGWSEANDDWRRESAEGRDYGDGIIMVILTVILVMAAAILAKVVGWL